MENDAESDDEEEESQLSDQTSEEVKQDEKDGDNNEGDLFFCHVIHHIPPLFHHDSLKLGVVSIFYLC